MGSGDARSHRRRRHRRPDAGHRLERRGFTPPLLVEKATTLRPHGLGLAVMGMRALARIGLEAPLLAAGSTLDRLVTIAPNGAELGEQQLGALAERFGPALGLHRSASIDTLTADLRAEVRLASEVRVLEIGRERGRTAGVVLDDGTALLCDLVEPELAPRLELHRLLEGFDEGRAPSRRESSRARP